MARVLSSCSRCHGSCNINNTATGREDIPTDCRTTIANAASHATSTGARQTPQTTVGSASDRRKQAPGRIRLRSMLPTKLITAASTAGECAIGRN
ncbi:hypothetical protein DYB28_010737 [Aphanomyces astaci]|nr:hypothetical protein DYB28_010737 [Aphanomyces astaci]